MAHGSEPVRVGMIANPVSARDVRRVLSDAVGLTLGERVAMLLRVLRVLASMGDGTHRAVASVCRDVPIVGISTGTNNAFPPMREVTVTAMGSGFA